MKKKKKKRLKNRWLTWVCMNSYLAFSSLCFPRISSLGQNHYAAKCVLKKVPSRGKRAMSHKHCQTLNWDSCFVKYFSFKNTKQTHMWKRRKGGGKERKDNVVKWRERKLEKKMKKWKEKMNVKKVHWWMRLQTQTLL